MSDIGTYEAAVMAAMCGAPWLVDVNNEHWFIVCTQSPDHPGPHVGMISWGHTARNSRLVEDITDIEHPVEYEGSFDETSS